MAAVPRASRSGAARRLLVSHALGATSTLLPAPLVAALVYDHTHSAWAIAALGASRTLPFVLLSSTAGRMADRVNRVALLRASHITRAGFASLLALTTTWHPESAVAVTALGMAVVITSTPAYPAAGASLPSLASGPELERRLAQLTCIEAGAWVAGPAAGGLLLDRAADWCTPCLVVLLSVAAAAAVPALPALTLVRDHTPRTPNSRFIALRVEPALLLAVVTANIAIDATGACLVLLLHAGPAYGLCVAALGAGVTVSLLLSAAAPMPPVSLSVAASGLCVAAAALIDGTPVRALLLCLAGAGAVCTEAETTTRILRRADRHLRGQILGALDQAIVGAALFGTVAGPLLSNLIGAGPAIFTAAAVHLISLTFLARPTPPTGAPRVRGCHPARTTATTGSRS